jgi:hypothetical protein
MPTTQSQVQKARKAGKCQRCGAAADPLYTVRFSNKARTKVAAEKADDDSRSVYCEACRDRRRKEYERTARANAKANGKPKAATKRSRAKATK